MGEAEDKGTQTEPISKPGSPPTVAVTPRRPMPTTTTRNVVRQAPKPTPRQTPVPRPQELRPQEPRPQEPVVKREPRPVAQSKPPSNVHVATAAGESVAETLPPDRGALPSARPVLPPKRQWQKSMGEIHVPTTLLKRRGPAADISSSSGGQLVDSAESLVDPPAATLQVADAPSTLPEAANPAVTPAPDAAGPTVAGTAAEPRRSPVQTNTTAAAARPASPQLGIMTAGKHTTPVAAKGPGAVRPGNMTAGKHSVAAKGPDAVRSHPGAHSISSPSASAKTGASNRSNAAADAAGLSMLGHSNNQQSSRTAGQRKPEAQAVAAAASDQPHRAQQPIQQADVPGPMPPAATDDGVMPDGGNLVTKRQPDREVLTIGEGGELRPMSALTDESFDTASSPTNSRLQTPVQANRASAEVPVVLPAAPAALDATQEDLAVAGVHEPSTPLSSMNEGDASDSRPSTADEAEASNGPADAAQTEAEYAAVPVHHASAGHLHRKTARIRPQSPLQPQMSGVHGSNPTLPPGADSGSVRTAKRAQHAAQPGRQSKVPPLNMAVMRALKQQVSGLVPLSGHGTSKAACAVLQQTAPASQRALSHRQAPPASLSPKKEAHSQLTPLSSSALSSRNLPDGTPLATLRPQPSDHLQAAQTAASQTQLMQPAILTSSTPRQTLSLDATVQLIGDMYDSKGVADLAALRQQAPCWPLQDFVQQYLQRRFGTGAGGSWLGAWQQLEAAVRRHGNDARVAAFATSCGLLQPAEVPSSAQVCLVHV